MESQSVRCQARLRRDGGPRSPAEEEEDRHVPRLSNYQHQKWALEQIRANMNYGSVLKQPAGQVCL